MSSRPSPVSPFSPGKAEIDPTAAENRGRLAAEIPEGLRVDLDTCFPELTGFLVSKMNKRRLGALINAAPLLLRCLEREEIIRYFTIGTSQNALDYLASGHWSMLFNQRLLVLTETRLLVIDCDGKGRPHAFLNAVPLDAVKNV